MFHSKSRRAWPHNHLVREGVDYDYAESSDVCFNDARRDLWRFLRMEMATMEVCKIDSVDVRPILWTEGLN